MDTEVDLFSDPGVTVPATPIYIGHKSLEDWKNRVIADSYEWQAWALAEITHWKEKCHELEIDILNLEGEFAEPIKPHTQYVRKKRSLFK